MIHAERVDLIKNGVSPADVVWADLGSGSGSFTLALAELLHPLTEIYSIEEDQRILNEQQKKFQTQLLKYLKMRDMVLLLKHQKKLITICGIS